jgi:hypothetical protein
LFFFSMFAIFAANENPSFVNNMYHPYPNEIEILMSKNIRWYPVAQF